jgi:hypothetical protein
MKISISAASRLTGKHRSTISKVASELQSFPGRKGALLYDSRELLQGLYIGTDGAPTASEALRQLSLARAEQVRLQNEITRKKRIPLDLVMDILDQTLQAMAATLKATNGKVMTQDSINEIFADFRAIPGRLNW